MLTVVDVLAFIVDLELASWDRAEPTVIADLSVYAALAASHYVHTMPNGKNRRTLTAPTFRSRRAA